MFIWYSELFYSYDIGIYLYSEHIVYIMFTQIHSVVIVLWNVLLQNNDTDWFQPTLLILFHETFARQQLINTCSCAFSTPSVLPGIKCN